MLLAAFWIGGRVFDGRTGISITYLCTFCTPTLFVFFFPFVWWLPDTDTRGALEPLYRVADSSVSWHVLGWAIPNFLSLFLSIISPATLVLGIRR